jgi:LysR family transcriptional activator of nhaA
VGVVDQLPKLLVRRLLEPALAMPEALHMVCREDHAEALLAELSLFRLDVVLSDAPVPPTVKVRAYSHLLGETGVTWFAAGDLVQVYRRRFPRSLDQAPLLLPTENTALRRALDGWFRELGVRPKVVAEFEDSALLKVFGQTGVGLFCAPSAVEGEVRRQYKVGIVGRTDAVKERAYAITVERRLRHPAVVAISTEARAELFAAR